MEQQSLMAARSKGKELAGVTRTFLVITSFGSYIASFVFPLPDLPVLRHG